jgi:hypothetical protein
MDKKKSMTRRELNKYRTLNISAGLFLGIFGGILISRYMGWDSLWKFIFLVTGLIIVWINYFIFENKYQRLLKELR